MSDYLDPATLTPETLYQLQAETWEQGAEHERERILNIIKEESCHCSDDCDRIDMFFPKLRDRINNV